MKMKLMKSKKYLEQKFSRKTADCTLRVSKSYIPFICVFSIWLCILDWFFTSAACDFLKVFTEKFQNIEPLNYVKGRVAFFCCKYSLKRCLVK